LQVFHLCNDAKLKITPSNQSLILAGETTRSGAGRMSLLDQASSLVAGGGALQRVTIMAARPDTTVVVQADYYPREDEPASSPALLEQSSSNTLPVLSAPAASSALTVADTDFASTDAETLSRPTAISFYMNPVQLYTRTQRGLGSSKAALLDVLA
jgi:hypothetical protein